MTTAVEDDGILPKNPCRIKGAGEEYAPERPVLTVVAQVFDLATGWACGQWGTSARRQLREPVKG